MPIDNASSLAARLGQSRPGQSQSLGDFFCTSLLPANETKKTVGVKNPLAASSSLARRPEAS